METGNIRGCWRQEVDTGVKEVKVIIGDNGEDMELV